MILTLQRRPSVGGATIGELTEGGARLCWTLEDELRERPDMPVALWKVKGSTAIPQGRYRVSLEHSPRFGPDTLTLWDVPGFEYIRMHAGNTVDDTEGCPLLGLKVTDAGTIVGGTSRQAVTLVQMHVRQAIKWGERVHIDVRNPPGWTA